jgi:hypothetical protein
VLREWGSGLHYPLKEDAAGRDALDELAEAVQLDPSRWWRGIRGMLARSSKQEASNLEGPLSVIPRIGSDSLRQEIVHEARVNPAIACCYWYAMGWLGSAHLDGAYRQLRRELTADAYIRYSGTDNWMDAWSFDAISRLNEHDPNEAWNLALLLLMHSEDAGWTELIGAVIVEELLQFHGDEFIDRVLDRARVDPRMRHALAYSRGVPDHLIGRVKEVTG